MSIHTVGDSHSYNGWPSWVIPHHIGPTLCFSFGRDKLSRCDIRNYGLKNGDTIIFCLGEIDCRCHVHKHLIEPSDYKQVIDGIVNNYVDTIKLNIEVSGLTFKNVCIYNVVPPVERYNTLENPEYPYLGSDEERKSYVLYFNSRLEEKCKDNSFLFFNVYNSYCDANGFLSKHLSDGNVHIRDPCYNQEFIQRHLL
jgi:hypothetical protein